MHAAGTERRRNTPLASPCSAAVLALVLALAAVLAPAPTLATAQRDAELGPILRQAITHQGCDDHPDHFDEEVFFKLHEPRLRRLVQEPQRRIAILQSVYCETHRVKRRYRDEKRFELRMTPELVLAVMDVESRFDPYAVSSAGAVGLMQVMPFWPRELGVENRLFGSIDFNVRLGVEILAYYMHKERNDHVRALGRYNGSLGRRKYPDLVLGRLNARWGS
ncbi:MAG: lytic transglycosylase domain-containing protein [Steroidobacteraceae bacterium]|nr:lytic transglycosylase domain-containing protein [Steroidobacteraceae bacterium]